MFGRQLQNKEEQFHFIPVIKHISILLGIVGKITSAVPYEKTENVKLHSLVNCPAIVIHMEFITK